MLRHKIRATCFTFVGIAGSIMLFTQIAALDYSPAIPQPTPYPALQVPAHIVPVPNTVSPELQKLIAAPFDPSWKVTTTSSAQPF